jgi:hypothetical protein
VEAQKKIEEMLRLENVQKNMEVAMEEMPEVSPRCSRQLVCALPEKVGDPCVLTLSCG